VGVDGGNGTQRSSDAIMVGDIAFGRRPVSPDEPPDAVGIHERILQRRG